MIPPANPERPGPDLARSLERALQLLRRARGYAEDVGSSPWDFAVEIERLEALGLSHCELRWMMHKGWVLAADETSVGGQRSFGEAGCSLLTPRTGFVLTDAGRQASGHAPALPLLQVPTNPDACERPKPEWNSVLRTLTVREQLVKRFRVPAMNQELILDVFGEEDWPDRIDDPLPPSPNLDSKRRLQSAIMCLNRNQKTRLLRFRGDGSGTGILWELDPSVLSVSA